MKRQLIVKCLIISPQDVQEERQAVVTAIEKWNARNGPAYEVLIHPVRWETHSVPRQGGHPQSLLPVS
jgi:hypothetical protein